MNNFKRKERVKQKDKGPTKKFSSGLKTPKPQDQKIQKFLPHLVSDRFVKTREEEEADSLYFALR